VIRALQLARLVLGAWMVFLGLSHFLGLVPLPPGATPLAAQLLRAFANSGLLDVAMAIELVAGALLLADRAVPFALAALMPLSTCALYWAVLLEQQPGWALLALLAFALNGLLMLAYLGYYRQLLRPGALAVGETSEAGYGKLFINPLSDTPARHYPAALATLLAAFAFYWLVPYANGTFGMMALGFPAVVLLAGWGRKLARQA
jgi:hypothetical protein